MKLFNKFITTIITTGVLIVNLNTLLWCFLVGAHCSVHWVNLSRLFDLHIVQVVYSLVFTLAFRPAAFAVSGAVNVYNKFYYKIGRVSSPVLS